MSSSLGVFIDNNIIKYAKLQKDKDVVKVDAYNVTFVEDSLENTIKRIISETYSYQTPVSINLSDEIYSTFDVSNLLNKKDAQNAIKIEYEMLCSEKGYTQALLDNRWVMVDKKEDMDKQKVTNIIANKNEISKRMALFDGNKVTSITPMPFSIANLIEKGNIENSVIVNIESKTQITTIVEGKVYSVEIFDEGMADILEEINKIENSYSKSYEACKNMTIYTRGGSELYSNTDPYMSIVSSTLLRIIEKLKEVLNDTFATIEKIYISGTAVCINNIDLFFQDYISNIACEILKPYFLKDISEETSIKEYIDVNSAIALALTGIDGSEVNFVKGKGTGKINSKKTKETKSFSKVGIKTASVDIGYKIKSDFVGTLQSSEKLILRSIFAFFMILVLYIIFSNSTSKQLIEKNTQVKKVLSDQQTEIAKIDSDITLISGRTTAYNTLIQELRNPTPTSDSTELKKRVVAKDAIPNLLNRIMFVIPKKVKINSITNTQGTHIVIETESEKYEQLGYFKSVLTSNNILVNVKSTPSHKDGNIVSVTIEGDLP